MVCKCSFPKSGKKQTNKLFCSTVGIFISLKCNTSIWVQSNIFFYNNNSVLSLSYLWDGFIICFFNVFLNLCIQKHFWYSNPCNSVWFWTHRNTEYGIFLHFFAMIEKPQCRLLYALGPWIIAYSYSGFILFIFQVQI